MGHTLYLTSRGLLSLDSSCRSRSRAGSGVGPEENQHCLARQMSHGEAIKISSGGAGEGGKAQTTVGRDDPATRNGEAAFLGWRRILLLGVDRPLPLIKKILNRM